MDWTLVLLVKLLEGMFEDFIRSGWTCSMWAQFWPCLCSKVRLGLLIFSCGLFFRVRFCWLLEMLGFSSFCGLKSSVYYLS